LADAEVIPVPVGHQAPFVPRLQLSSTSSNTSGRLQPQSKVVSINTQPQSTAVSSSDQSISVSGTAQPQSTDNSGSSKQTTISMTTETCSTGSVQPDKMSHQNQSQIVSLKFSFRVENCPIYNQLTEDGPLYNW
jgi:hypothetical protein